MDPADADHDLAGTPAAAVSSWDQVSDRLSYRPPIDLLVLALLLIMIGVFAVLVAIIQGLVVGLIIGLQPDASHTGFKVFWFEFVFDGYAWIAVVLPLGLASIFTGIRVWRGRWFLATAAIFLGWAAVAVAQQEPQFLTAAICIVASGVAVARLWINRADVKWAA